MYDPDHGFDVDADVGGVEQDFLAVEAVVDEDLAGSADADEELIEVAVGVFAAHFLPADAEDDEVAADVEGDVAGDFAIGEGAAEVGEAGQAMHGDAGEGGGARADGFGGRKESAFDGIFGGGIAGDAGGIAGDDGMGRDAVGNDGSGTDHGVASDFEAGEDGGVGSDGSALSQDGAGEGGGALFAAREGIVGEGGVGADEDVVFDGDAVPELDAAFDGDAITEDDIVFDEGVIAEVAIAADAGAGQDVGVGPDACAIADGGRFHQRRVMRKITHPLSSFLIIHGWPRGIFIGLIRHARPLLIGYFLILLGPLWLSEQARPFAFWDDLTIPGKLPGAFALEPSGLPHAFYSFWFNDSYLFRPLILFFYNLFYLAFGGEFWILRLLKLAARAGYLLLTDRLLAKLAFPPVARLMVFTFLLFHPALLDPMLFSDDGWLALAMSGALLLAAGQVPFLDLGRMTAGRYAGFTACVILAPGTKEVGVVFAAVVAAVATVRTRGWARWRVTPLWLMAMFTGWKLADMLHKGLRVNTPGAAGAVGGRLEVLKDHLVFMTLRAPLHLTEILLPLAIVVGVVALYRSGDGMRKWVGGVALVCSAGMLLFTSNVAQAAMRYVIPSIVLLAVPLAAAVEWVPLRYRRPAGAAFAILFPLLMAGNLYAQALGFQQLLYEYADIIALLERKAQEGLKITPSTDLGPEYTQIPGIYFGSYSYRAYGAAGATPVNDAATGVPAGDAVLLSLRPPAQWRTVPGYLERVRMVEAIGRGREGALEKFTSFYVAVRKGFGFYHLLYDYGAPVPSPDPLLFVHTFGAAEDGGSPVRTECRVQEGGGASERVWLTPGIVHSHQVPQGQTFRMTMALGAMPSLEQALYKGEVKVESGMVTVGVTDAQGTILWNAAVPVSAEWQALPGPGARMVPNSGPVQLYVEVRSGGSIAVRNVRVAPVIYRSPVRRYGSLSR